MQRYERLGVLTTDEVLPFVQANHPRARGKRPEREFHGQRVYMDSSRYLTYAQKGCKCVRCGIEATFFAVERAINNKNTNPERCHLNLYAVDAAGNEILFTVDHIVPESKGGKKAVENLQPMCSDCNSRKMSIHDDVDKQLPVKVPMREIKLALKDCPSAVEAALLLLDNDMAAQLYLRMQEEKKLA